MSAIIISIILIFNCKSKFFSHVWYDHELKQESFHLAESCVIVALLKLLPPFLHSPPPLLVRHHSCWFTYLHHYFRNTYGTEDPTTHQKLPPSNSIRKQCCLEHTDRSAHRYQPALLTHRHKTSFSIRSKQLVKNILKILRKTLSILLQNTDK